MLIINRFLYFGLSREERLSFIDSHYYTFMPNDIPDSVFSEGNKSRKNHRRRVEEIKKTDRDYVPSPQSKRKHILKCTVKYFNMDNIYEDFVFREMIAKINDCFETPIASLDHWIPIAKGGKHHGSNWVVISNKANEIYADDVKLEKPTWRKQRNIIEKMLNKSKNREKVREVRQFYNKFFEVYGD